MAKLLNHGILKQVEEKLKKEQEETKSGWGDKYLAFKAGNDYRVRLLSTEEAEPIRFKAPFIDSYVHVYKDEETGKFSIVTCPTTFEPISGFKKCPVCTHAQPLYNSKSPEDKKLYDLYKRRYNGYMAVYVIEDTCNPSNVGKIKIMRYGIEIDKFLKLKILNFKKESKNDKTEADKKPTISTRKVSPLGDSAFNFGEGYDLCINVSKKTTAEGEYNSYTCEFDMQNKYDLSKDENFNEDDVMKQLEEFDLYSVVPNYKQADVQAFFNRYVLGKTEDTDNTEQETEQVVSPSAIKTISSRKSVEPAQTTPEQTIPTTTVTASVTSTKASTTEHVQSPKIEEVSKDELEDLLAGL